MPAKKEATIPKDDAKKDVPFAVIIVLNSLDKTVDTPFSASQIRLYARGTRRTKRASILLN
jgi:hypothetical protein